MVGLARADAPDIRPNLLRILTDLYVQKSAHSADEERHYTELALRLLDVVELPVRVAVAIKLAAFSGAPIEVLRRLARDVIEVAAPVLAHTHVLSQAELVAIAEAYGPRLRGGGRLARGILRPDRRESGGTDARCGRDRRTSRHP